MTRVVMQRNRASEAEELALQHWIRGKSPAQIHAYVLANTTTPMDVRLMLTDLAMLVSSLLNAKTG